MASKNDSNANRQTTDSDDVSREQVLDSNTLSSSVTDPDTAVESTTTTISSCATIDSPGTYVLGSDVASSADTCIEITATDVILDGQGYELRYTGEDRDAVGIRVTGSNVTIRNIALEAWGIGIVQNGYDGLIRGASVNQDDPRGETGILLAESYRVTVRDTAAIGADVGLTIDSGSNNTIQNDDVGALSGPAIQLLDTHRNAIRGNDLSGDINISVQSSNENVLEANDASESNVYGIEILDSYGNKLLNNLATSNTEVGISVRRAIGTVLDSNVVLRNGSWGVELRNTDRATLTRNVVRQNSRTIDRGGVYLANSDKNSLIRNTVCENGSGEQIVVDDESEKNLLFGNVTEC